MEHFYQLAIIGAGPAGIATAIESYVLGMRDIVLLEKDENHNATIRKFYKDNKRVDKDWKGQKVELDGTLYFMDGTKESTLDFFDQLLDNEVVELKTHTEVQKIMKIEGGFEVFIAGGSIKAAYVVVTIGRMGKPNKPDYKIPPSIKNQIHFTLDGCSQGEKVMVVGGGDSAIEYAVELCDRNEVSICYRRGTFRRANPTNQTDIEKAVANGSVRPLLNTEIIELESESGKVKVLFSDGSSELFDRLVYAIGGTTPSGFLQSSGIREEDGKPVHDENYQTNVEGLFVAGDITQES
ncbi:MAG: pyridine nucleotide-disulfide oxidoreductase, partial [Sulfuricurvum sp. RIFCSPLOWO2_02_FULL_43_45]